MNENLSILNISRRVQSARWLSCALLLLVAYSTTAEAVHSHKNLGQPIQSAESRLVTTSDGPSQSRGQIQSGECLACQFQQTLSSAEFFSPQLILAPVVSTPAASYSAVSVKTFSLSTGHGRAPPVFS